MKKIEAIGYLRYSDKRQDGNHSLDIQKNQILQLAERENLEIIKWRADKATSAFHHNAGKRKGIQMVLDDIANGAGAICFYEESRVTRSITDFYNDVYMPIKEQYPQTKFFSTQSADEWDPDDIITQAKLIFAAEESEIKSIRSIDAQDNALNKGKPKRPGSRTPIGYDMVDGVLIPNEDAIIVELIFYLTSFGHSQQTIANYLNKCGIYTEKVRSWNSSTVGYVLSNRAYLGDLTWNVRTSFDISKPKNVQDIDLFRNIHEPIINPTVFHLVKQTNKLKEKYGTMNTPYYLRGIIKCHTCNLLLVARDNSPKGRPGKYRIYRCPKCKMTAPIMPLHKTVLKDLQNKWRTQHSTLVSESQKQLDSWLKKLSKAKGELKRLLDRILYNKSMLKDEIAMDPRLEEVFTHSQKTQENEIAYLSVKMEEIQKLSRDKYLDILLKEMFKHSLLSFKNSELRVFFLMFFDKITINFEKNNDIRISYRLSPFVLLENMTGQVTEQVEKFEDLTS